MTETPTQILTKWYKNVMSNENKCKILLVYGETGTGKTYFVNKYLADKFNLKILSDDYFNELRDEKHSNYCNFLTLFFDVIGLREKNTNKKVMVINENYIYNFHKCESIISKLIDDNIKECKNKYPMIIIMNDSHNKFLSDVKKKAINIYIDKPNEDTIKDVLTEYYAENGIVEGKNKKPSKAFVKLMLELCDKNLNKLFVLMNNLVNNYCENKKITNTILNEFLDDNVENNIKNDIYEANGKILKSYNGVEETLEVFNHESTFNPLVMEECYIQKLEAYESKYADIFMKNKDIVKRLTKSFTYSNLYDNFIFNSQRWDLTKIYGYFSCVLPSYLLSKLEVEYSPFVSFPSDINRTSIQKINTKQILLIYDKINIMNIGYYIHIGEYVKYLITECLQHKKDEQYWSLLSKLNNFMKYYKLKTTDVAKIMKINKLDTNQITFTKTVEDLFFN